jgi:hypothetical protein
MKQLLNSQLTVMKNTFNVNKEINLVIKKHLGNKHIFNSIRTPFTQQIPRRFNEIETYQNYYK